MSTSTLSSPAPDPVIERNLSLSIKDGVCFSLMAGCGESFFSAFAIFLKATSFQIGVLASLPQLLGAFAQFASVKILHLLQNRHRLILRSVILQAVTCLPLAALPLFFTKGGGFGFLLASVIAYYVLGNLANPPWNSLMGDLVHPDRRGQFFAHRNRLISIVTFSSLVGAGLILHASERSLHPAVGFAVIFTIAFFARFGSAYFLSRMSDPGSSATPDRTFRFGEFLRRARRSNFARFMLYSALINFCVQIAGPFFALYMLRDLGFSYIQFTAASGTAVLAQFLTFNAWGGFADRFGNKKVLTLTGLALPVMPVLWLIWQAFPYILVIQVVGGFVWAGFSLSMGNFLFDSVSPQRRAACVALYNTGNAVGFFLGATTGGWLASRMPETLPLGFESNLQVLFLLSGLLRLVVSLSLLRTFREERLVEPLRVRDLMFRPEIVRPFSGVRFDIFTGTTARRTRARRPERRRETFP